MKAISNQKPFLIDTSILIAAFSTKEKKQRKDIAVKIIEQGIVNHSYICQSSVIDLIIFFKKNPTSCSELSELILDLCAVFEILTPTEKTIENAIALSVTKKIDYTSALFSQMALDNNISVIYTENKEIKKVKEIKVMMPFNRK